jgi:hypothetical protein
LYPARLINLDTRIPTKTCACKHSSEVNQTRLTATLDMTTSSFRMSNFRSVDDPRDAAGTSSHTG